MEELGADGLKVLRGVEDGKAYAKGLNNVGTARGLMIVLARLAEGSAVSKAALERDARHPPGPEVQRRHPRRPARRGAVAHKTGSIRAVYHDAGMIEPPGRKPFVLVVLTRGIEDEPAAKRLVAEVARVAFDHALGH